MDIPGPRTPELAEDLSAAVVAFLREWLPPAAMAEYRRLMLTDPEGWVNDPHFQGGIIPDMALRGNGITEQVLGISDLDTVWPGLLQRAVLGQAGADGGNRKASGAGVNPDSSAAAG